jgi:CRISPR/Cas system CSM-associated protein Csm4 (group 5 of RAMP superfamily)
MISLPSSTNDRERQSPEFKKQVFRVIEKLKELKQNNQDLIGQVKALTVRAENAEKLNCILEKKVQKMENEMKKSQQNKSITQSI